MSNENQKPAAADTKVDPAKTQPAPKQNQGEGRPASAKPAGQQK